MNTKLVTLVVVTLVVVLASYIVLEVKTPDEKQPSHLYPQLADKLTEINKIELTNADHTLSLSREDSTWKVDQLDGYPALLEKIKSTLVGVSDLKIVAKKTDNPDLYPKLGVEEPDQPGAQSVKIIFKDETDQTLVDLIVGLKRKSKAASHQQGLYVRKNDDPDSYLVTGQLDVSAEKFDWYDSKLFDIQDVKIKEAAVNHADGENYRVLRKSPEAEFELTPLNGKKKPTPVVLNPFGLLLENMTALDVKTTSPTAKPEVETVLYSFEGVTTKFNIFKENDTPYVSIAFEYSPPPMPEQDTENKNSEAETEDSSEDSATKADNEAQKRETYQKLATSLNEKLAGWMFEIPDYKYTIISKRLKALTDLSTNKETKKE